MREALALVSTLLAVVATIIRIQRIRRRDTHPAIATWTMFEIAIVLSLWSYSSLGQNGIVSNIVNFADAFLVVAILGAIVITPDPDKYKMEKMDASCFFALGLVLVFWLARRDALATNLATQAIMTIAYLPTLFKMRRMGKNTEPFLPWVMIWLSGLAGLAIATADRNPMAMTYAGRSTIMTTMLLVVMVRIEKKSQEK